jgi:transcriptional antiterminator Rof (Rho-off)
MRARVAVRAAAFHLAMRAAVAVHALAFQLAMRAGVAVRAVAFQLAMRAADAVRAVAFQLAMRAGVAVRAEALQLAMRAGVAVRAEAFKLAMRARVAVRAVVFQLAMRAAAAVRAAAFPLAMRAGVAGRAVAFHLAVRAAFTCISHTVPPASPRAKAPSGHTRKPPHHFIGGAPGKMLPRTSRYSRKSGRPTFAKTAELQPESRRFSSDWFPTDMSSCHEEFFRETAAQRLPGLSERLASPGDTRRSASETSPDELPRRGARPFAPSRLPPRPSP